MLENNVEEPNLKVCTIVRSKEVIILHLVHVVRTRAIGIVAIGYLVGLV